MNIVLICKKKGALFIGAIRCEQDVSAPRQVKGTSIGGKVSTPINKCITQSLEQEGGDFQETDDLLKTVEHLREQLVRLFLEKGDFLHDEVVSLSQQLDTYLLQIQMKMMQKP
ncbi:aspartyl-phosphate phosphatase Spo0E family protein [Brevibacillus gelatini]|uniref:aspartyl-phosphate phosphatase Spo0E family protein n=1 Tax=Brevibacillus gelatini TaxID=1655277 RepID=UPI001FE36CCD|nr:aspartyl-phosphate phosphatase Spo0E family protein [Brevibacillus gelatini]